MKINLNLIKNKRDAMNYTIDDMAKFIGLTNGSMYWKRENGNYKFKSDELPKLCEKLEIPFSELYSSEQYSKIEIDKKDVNPNKSA